MSCLKLGKLAKLASCYRLSNQILLIRFSSRQCEDDSNSRNKCTTPSVQEVPCQIYKKRHIKPMDSSPQYSYLMRSMWEKPPCCVTCVAEVAPVRHDVLYLKNIDYRERNYQRTWPSCPMRCLVPKKCDFPKVNLPEMEKRPRGQGNPDAKMCMKVHECAKMEKFDPAVCPAVCKSKVACYPAPKSSCCQKRCTLYPSYSECCAKALIVKRPTECGCLNPTGLCEVNEYARRMGIKFKDEA